MNKKQLQERLETLEKEIIELKNELNKSDDNFIDDILNNIEPVAFPGTREYLDVQLFGIGLDAGICTRFANPDKIYQRLTLEWLISKVIEHFNEEWKPDWKDENQHKYVLSYDNIDQNFPVTFWTINQDLPDYLYMKSNEVAGKVQEILSNWKGKNLLKMYFDLMKGE